MHDVRSAPHLFKSSADSEVLGCLIDAALAELTRDKYRIFSVPSEIDFYFHSVYTPPFLFTILYENGVLFGTSK